MNEKKGINVLSLFDGMSCGQIALNKLGINPSIYYSSEIDKHAISQTKLNFPDTVHLGSVVDVNVSDLERIDLLIGGSPCQSFSFAGKRKGMATKCEIEITRLEQYMELKEQGFEFEGQSYLFWEYMRILTDIRKYNPGVLFLLENVEMGKKWERVLSEAIGVYGVHINSALVSAQNRKRIYWTNIRTRQEGLFGDLHADIPQPDDRGIMLRDILEKDVDEKYYINSDSMMNFVTDEWRQNKLYTQINGNKSLPQMARQYSSWCGDDNHQELEPNEYGKTNCLTSVQKDNLIMTGCIKLGRTDEEKRIRRIYMKQGIDFTPFRAKEVRDIDFKKMKTLTSTISKDNLVISGTLRTHKDGNGFREVQSGKGACVPARAREDGSGQNVAMIGNRIRRLTPTECARLQTVPDWYKWSVSDTQQYKMLGNGWTVEVIVHIFSFLKF